MTQLSGKLSIVHVVWFLTMIGSVLVSPVLAQEAQERRDDASANIGAQDGRQSTATHVAGTIGLPPIIVLEPEVLNDGEYEVARDILTGDTLRLRVSGGETTGAVIETAEGRTITLEEIETEGRSCSTIHCLHNQPPSCFGTPSGGCVCTCGAFQANRPD